MKEYTTDDLLKLLELNKHGLSPIRKNVNDVHQFIEALDIKGGNHKVKNALVYKAYVLWGGKRSKMQFVKLFSQYFPPQMDRNFRFYNLNIQAVKLINKVDNGLIKI